MAQGISDNDVFLSVFKQRVNDIFTPNGRERLEGSTRDFFL